MPLNRMQADLLQRQHVNAFTTRSSLLCGCTSPGLLMCRCGRASAAVRAVALQRRSQYHQAEA